VYCDTYLVAVGGLQIMMIDKADFSKLTVLLVDDNAFIRRLLNDILRSFRVGKIVQAASVEEALSHLENLQPDVIFCDWLMVPTDGLSLLRAVRQGRTPIDLKTPIIMLTGETRLDRVAIAIADGADSYIAKPISAKNLMSHLIRLIAADKPVHYLD
jgi:two-component system chemotaxis response regulator CheY